MHLTQTFSIQNVSEFRFPLIINPLSDRLEPAYSELQPEALISQLLIEHVVFEDVHPEDKLTNSPDNVKGS